jgi:hypothetical protein
VLGTGSVTSVSTAEECGRLDDPQVGGPSQQCQEFLVTGCDGDAAVVTLRVTENPGNSGTVVFFSGAAGRGYWASDTNPGFPLESHLLQKHLSTGNNDFKIVEIKWADAWNHGDDQHMIGPARLACRVATVVSHLVTNPTYHVQQTPVCATGQSGGASQLAFTLTHYGMESTYGGVIFTSGPPYADLELACGTEFQNPDGTPDVTKGVFDSISRWGVDLSYGTPNDPTWARECGQAVDEETCGYQSFPTSLCLNHQHEPAGNPTNQDFADRLVLDSIALDTARWDYEYPGTGIYFVFGLSDNGSAKPQGKLFELLLDSYSANDVLSEDVNAPHEVHASEEGTEEILYALSLYCEAALQ